MDAAEAQVQGELGKYRLIAELARGGMGVVYLAVMQGLGGFYKTLVIKQLKPELAHDPAFLSMFMDEARFAAKLHHPNIVQVYEVDSFGDRHFLSMEYLEGTTLRRTLRVLKTEFTLGMHLGVLSEILRGLHHAHELADESGENLGLVHRDMSPHNIFVTFDGQAKIVDFGIVKTRDSSQHTEVGVFKGKVTYMPPEQAMSEQPVDRRADIYSMGVMLFEAVSGKRVWKGMQDMQVLTKLVQKQIPTLDQVMPSAPAELRRICNKAMAWDREDRYETAEAFQKDLDAYILATKSTVNMRYVGTLLASALADERAKMKTLVDRKIAQLKAGGAQSRILSIAPPSLVTLQDPDDSASIEAMLDERDFEEIAEPSRRLELVAEPELEGESALVRSLRRSRLRMIRPQLIAAAGVIAFVIGYFAFVAPPNKSGTASVTGVDPFASAGVTAATTSPPTSTESVLPPQELIDVQIHVVPANATVTVDDAPLKGPPFAVHFPKEQATHTARASAPGYATKTQEFGGDHDVLLQLTLARVQTPLASFTRTQAPHTTYVAPPPPQNTSDPPATPTPTHVTPPPPSTVRPIDSASPYSSGSQ